MAARSACPKSILRTVTAGCHLNLHCSIRGPHYAHATCKACLSILHMACVPCTKSSRLAAGAEGHSACVAIGGHVQAEGLQLDSYVPGSSHPVLTQFLAPSPAGHGVPGRSAEETMAPFHVNLEVRGGC